MAVDEKKLEQARQDYLAGKYESIRATAIAHELVHSTLIWYLDKIANEDPQPRKHNLHLSAEQDQVLQDELRRLIRWNINPNLDFIRGLAQRLVYQSFNGPKADAPVVGKCWPKRWLKRHPKFECDWLKP